LKISLFSVLFFITALSLWSLDREPELIATSAILYDFTTGRVLFEKEADLPIAPASMTKLITLFIGLQSIEEGLNSREEIVHITREGSSFSRPVGSSLMLLEEGQKVSYIDILKGLAISSGNDAAYALAHHISGSDILFVEEMNHLVQSLGYRQMYFEDPDGWSSNNRVTAREYAQFAADYIRTFPFALEEIHSQEYFTYPQEENLPPAGARIVTPRKKKNTNILLGKVDGVDGLKTGYIDESGFNFTATAKRGDSRFISVVLGIKDVSYWDGIAIRAEESARLLEYGFSNYKTIFPSEPELGNIPMWEGKTDTLVIEINNIPGFTLSMEEMLSFKSTLNLPEELTAPISKGDMVGTLTFQADDRELGVVSIFAAESIEKANIFKVLWHKIVRQYRKLTNP